MENTEYSSQEKNETKRDRILVVEDEVDIREMLAEAISDWFPEKKVDEASNGAEAIDLLTKRGPEKFALIISDILMPVMSGDQFVRKIVSEFDSRIPILILSAVPISGDFERITEQEQIRFLRKPFLDDEFHKVLQELLKPPPHRVGGERNDVV